MGFHRSINFPAVRSAMLAAFIRVNGCIRSAAKSPSASLPDLRQSIETHLKAGIREAVLDGGPRDFNFRDDPLYAEISSVYIANLWRIVPLTGERTLSVETLQSNTPPVYSTACLISDYFASMAFIADPFGRCVYYAGPDGKVVVSESWTDNLPFFANSFRKINPLPNLSSSVSVGVWSPWPDENPDPYTKTTQPWFVGGLEGMGYRFERAPSTVAGILKVIRGQAGFYASPSPPLPDALAAGRLAKSAGLSVTFYAGSPRDGWSLLDLHPLMMGKRPLLNDAEDTLIRKLNRRTRLPMLLIAAPEKVNGLAAALGLPESRPGDAPGKSAP